jgi:hypothetical protein
MWHYTIDGQRFGPLDDAALDRSIAEGTITPDTLVWREGLEAWTPLRQVTAGQTADSCSICGKPVGADNLIELAGQRVCAACKPAAVQSLREGVMPASIHTAWRDGKKLVTHDQAELPPRCFQCNQPAAGIPVKKKLQRASPVFSLVIFAAVFLNRIFRGAHTPAFQLAIAAGFLGLVFAPRFLAKRATIDIHLCDRHLQWRKYITIARWCVTGVAAVLVFLSIVERERSLLIFAPIAIFIVTLSWIFVLPRVQTTRIKDKTVWLVGAGKAFLASLPQWPG